MSIKKTLSAVVLATAMSGSVFAACTANVDMGKNQITNATMKELGTASEVATKAYVDNLIAGTNPVLQLSAESNAKVANFAKALTYCVGLTGDSADRPWRLPSFEELLVAASSHTDGSASANFLWTRTPYNLSTGRTQDLDSDGQGTAGGHWILFSLANGNWDGNKYNYATHVGRCVR